MKIKQKSSSIDSEIYTDKKVNLKYEFLDKIGQGGFCSVYKCINIQTQKEVALKFDKFNRYSAQSLSVLQKEMVALRLLSSIPEVPQAYSLHKWSKGYYIQMELMNGSLEKQFAKKISYKQIKNMACQLIDILQKIHEKGIIHQDIKPENIMRNKYDKLSIIDFGLCSIKKDPSFKEPTKRQFIGTPRYASLAAHQNRQQNPKDDIESLLYVLAFLYSKKTPWSNIPQSTIYRLETIYRYKKERNAQWFKACGQPFSNAYSYISQIEPHEQLDYGYIKKLFQFHSESFPESTSNQPPTILFKLNQCPQNVVPSKTEIKEQLVIFGADSFSLKPHYYKCDVSSVIKFLTQKIINQQFTYKRRKNKKKSIENMQINIETDIIDEQGCQIAVGKENGLCSQKQQQYVSVKFKNPFQRESPDL